MATSWGSGSISTGIDIKYEHVKEILDTLNNISKGCQCNCNYACTCNCNYCTCTCNHSCTCNCVY